MKSLILESPNQNCLIGQKISTIQDGPSSHLSSVGLEATAHCASYHYLASETDEVGWVLVEGAVNQIFYLIKLQF